MDKDFITYDKLFKIKLSNRNLFERFIAYNFGQ